MGTRFTVRTQTKMRSKQIWKLKALFLAQLEREAVVTRKAVERVPEGHNHWKPHAKSMEMGRLAALVDDSARMDSLDGGTG
jgi:DNA topoisomerase VI subunit B